MTTDCGYLFHEHLNGYGSTISSVMIAVVQVEFVVNLKWLVGEVELGLDNPLDLSFSNLHLF